MKFVSIDFETANPKRVSACALGVAVVEGNEIVETMEFLIRPVGGHAEFQTRIHGICEEHTRDKPDFKELYLRLSNRFNGDVRGYSLFDSQVLNALNTHFVLGLDFRYNDVCALARSSFPLLSDHRLPTVAKHLGVKLERHHSALADAIACAQIAIKLLTDKREIEADKDVFGELKGLLIGILADGVVNYREAATLLYWLEDHQTQIPESRSLRSLLLSTINQGKLSADAERLVHKAILDYRQSL